MNITNEQVQVAVAAGLALTNPESEAPIPMKHASGAVILHQILLAIGAGQVTLQGAPQRDVPPPPATKPPRRKPRANLKKSARKKK